MKKEEIIDEILRASKRQSLVQIGLFGILTLLVLVVFILVVTYHENIKFTGQNVLVSILSIGSPMFLFVSDLIDFKKIGQVRIKVKTEPNVKITPSQFVRGASFNFEFSDKTIEVGFSSGKKFKQLWAALNELEKTTVVIFSPPSMFQ